MTRASESIPLGYQAALPGIDGPAEQTGRGRVVVATWLSVVSLVATGVLFFFLSGFALIPALVLGGAAGCAGLVLSISARRGGYRLGLARSAVAFGVVGLVINGLLAGIVVSVLLS